MVNKHVKNVQMQVQTEPYFCLSERQTLRIFISQEDGYIPRRNVIWEYRKNYTVDTP